MYNATRQMDSTSSAIKLSAMMTIRVRDPALARLSRASPISARYMHRKIEAHKQKLKRATDI